MKRARIVRASSFDVTVNSSTFASTPSSALTFFKSGSGTAVAVAGAVMKDAGEDAWGVLVPELAREDTEDHGGWAPCLICCLFRRPFARAANEGILAVGQGGSWESEGE